MHAHSIVDAFALYIFRNTIFNGNVPYVVNKNKLLMEIVDYCMVDYGEPLYGHSKHKSKSKAIMTGLARNYARIRRP